MRVACRFERRDCQHMELFQSEYKRTNRTKQTKILRCFPHCCPEHLNRSYCGTALCVKVEIAPAAKQATTVDPTSLLLYAHFEEAQANFLSLNDEFSYDEVTSSIQTEQTPKGKWIEGSVMDDGITERSCLFRLNPGARWYYEWESAATKAQRFTKHVLRVYTFQRISESRLRVVAIACSSAFMVVSYRRAPMEVRAEREALEALRAAVNAQKIAGGDGSDNSKDSEAKPRVSRLRQLVGYENKVWEDRKLWECRHPDVMTLSKQLAMLHALVHFVDASQFEPCLDQWSLFLNAQTADARVGAAHDRDVMTNEASGPFSWAFLLPLWQAKRTANALNDRDEYTMAQHEPLSRVVHLCARLTGWLALDKSNTTLYRRFLRSYSLAALDKDRMRASYMEAIKLVHELVDRFPGWNKGPSVPSTPSLATLSEEVMTVAFQYEHLKPLRRRLMEILSANKVFGFQEFVAQLRAQFICQQSQRRVSRARKQADETSAFDGAWAFNGDLSSVSPIGRTTTLGVSLGSMLTFMRELGRVSIRSIDAQTLEICSDWNACSVPSDENVEASDGMVLVLDSRPRIFRNFPSGLSSSISFGAYSYGDYRGKIMSVDHFALEISSWPVDSSSELPALRWKFQVRVQEDTDRRAPTGNKCDVLVVDAAVEEGFWETDCDNHAPDFLAMSFDQKQQRMKVWYPVYQVSAVFDCIKK